MTSAARALNVVSDTKTKTTGKNKRPSLAAVDTKVTVEVTGDLDLTRETMASWKAGQRICRARKRHNWTAYTVWEHRTYYDVVEVCSHCKNRRHADFVKTAWGLRKASDWQPDYRDGYLLPKGAARIGEELHDELTASDILSRRIVEAPDDEES